MLQVNFIRANKERVLAGLKKRNAKDDLFQTLESILKLDDDRKRLKTESDEANAERNRFSAEIGALMKQGKKEEAEQSRSQVASLKERIASIEEELKSTEEQLTELLYLIPNIPHESVPVGITPEDNEIFRPGPDPLPNLGDAALPHWEIAAKYKVFDLELGVKLTGAGFPVYRGKGAKLERALINFFLDEAAAAGYEEIIPPLMVNEDTARGTGQLPDKESQMYYVGLDNLYLIPTAEVPVTNIYRDQILDVSELPIKMTAYTPCFRREAGSYGAHVRGLNRVHQFDKIEIVQIAHPDKSYEILMQMLEHVAALLNKLGLPFRILRLCGGDMGFTSALTFDFEVWSAAQKRWLEVSSVSNFETYQSNRMKMRFRDGKDIQLVHTLNGSALALARIVASILENNQSPEGVIIPEVLRKYTGFDLLN
ncbi:MAG: serine--tRNA ligase [Haliscomenobacter sp.]|uniref:serine--tRNA ligase n=1 Tax=Haliscomenobacter sp. TaxID=2717303 RepID=UPI0029AC04CD|nr:serine--tRNA ligase [Haliscomenobacter sp.]MDX2070602.1 serine--tRNA ligase [Haliscomenobacter sp.]